MRLHIAFFRWARVAYRKCKCVHSKANAHVQSYTQESASDGLSAEVMTTAISAVVPQVSLGESEIVAIKGMHVIRLCVTIHVRETARLRFIALVRAPLLG